MKKNSALKITGLCASCLLFLVSCEDNQSLKDTDSNSGLFLKNKMEIPVIDFYALADGLMIDKFSTANPEVALSSAFISGLQADEKILSIDFRPATGQLYGLGSSSRLYVINPESGIARAIGSGPFSPALSDGIAGFDFNPTVDRIRVVTSSGQNFRLNPETGTVAATDVNINGPTGVMVSAVAYTNNVAGATTTTLYDIDLTSQKLYKQLPPNAGTLVLVGDLGLNIVGDGGFDIFYQQDVALGIFEVNNKSTLFSVDLNTGNAVILAKYKKDLKYTGIAIPTQPVAYAVTAINNLLIFNPNTPSIVVTKAITGMSSGETVLGIDFRPLNGQLYALGSTSRLYTINASSGAATAVGSSTFSVALSGTDFGFDFNPLADRIRIISNTGQNLRVNPANGAVTVDSSLNPSTTGISAAAYTNNFAGTTATMLFDIDVSTDKLYLQNPPNSGTLVEIGNLGLNADIATGFDIGGATGTAFAVLTSSGTTNLYEINTTSGAASVKGSFTSPVTGFTIGLGF
ncbi:DUF4394 domain-containing protein [Flavobacterium sp. LB3P45]|uniref:DUF4394 domain-containing protein n=1 Tax=Flavobacterium fructosi TaxID=3230416 RepID=A0ABW6HRM5_9FLAO